VVAAFKARHRADRTSSTSVYQTKRLCGLSGYSYDERLRLLKLDSLELRRTRFDFIMCYKIVYGLVAINRDEFFQLCVSTTRDHPYKIYKHFSKHSSRSSFFSERVVIVVNLWNNLPTDRMFCSVNMHPCLLVSMYFEQINNDDDDIAQFLGRLWEEVSKMTYCVSRVTYKSSSEDEIAKVNVLRRHRTCRGQSLRPLN